MKTWEKFFKSLNEKEYFKSLMSFLDEEYASKEIYPKRENLFKAFELTPVDIIKVVLIGQDPYHEPGQAMGLSFSVPDGVKLPPSLKNIYKELENDLGVHMDYKSGDLTYLAKQGVLLINAYLSVVAHKAMSHKRKEYELFMADLMKFLNDLDQPIVFMLWGNFAAKYANFLANPKHLIIKATHPSPLGANQGGWFNEHIFSRCNDYLKSNNVDPICWANSISLFD